MYLSDFGVQPKTWFEWQHDGCTIPGLMTQLRRSPVPSSILSSVSSLVDVSVDGDRLNT